MEDLSGKQLGAYQIVAPLGEGGMAAVYRAYQPSMDRQVAIKVLPRQYSTSPEYLARFKQEARLLARLQHPHILPVFDSGESDGYTYIVMPLVGGGTLAAMMQGGALSLSRAVTVVSQVGDALDYAHANGLIHRDIKPSNILIDERGNSLLMDFGIARMVEATTRLTQAGGVIGTPAYMSPEQGSGQALDKRSDIYSLAVVLFELLTGRVPYQAETPLAVLFKHVHDPLPLARKLNPGLTEAVELVLLKALAKKPEDRFQSMGDFVRALQVAAPVTATGQAVPAASATAPDVTQVMPGAAVQTPRPAAAATPSTPPRRNTDTGTARGASSRVPLVAGLSLAALLALVISFFALWRGGPSAGAPTSTPTAAVVGAASATPLPVVAAATPLPAPTATDAPAANTPEPVDAEQTATSAPLEVNAQATLDAIATEIAAIPAATEIPVLESATPTLPVDGTQPELIFAEQFAGNELNFDVWSREGDGDVKLGGQLDLSSAKAAFPLVLTDNTVYPATGSTRLRFRMQHPSLNACGVGFHLTSFFPSTASSEAAWQEERDSSIREGFALSIWQDATNGLRVAFRGAGQNEERTLFGGTPNTAPHAIIVDRSNDRLIVRVDGRIALTVRAPALPAYVSFGHPAKIETCAGYWSSMRVSAVEILRLQAAEAVTGYDQTAEPTASSACRPRWFFAPSPDGCPLSARTRVMTLQRFEQGSVLHFADTNQVFVFLDGGSWFNFNGITPEKAVEQVGNRLGARSGNLERWRACSGHAENGDEVTAYIADINRRVLSWTVRKSNGQPLRWTYLDGVQLLRCG